MSLKKNVGVSGVKQINKAVGKFQNIITQIKAGASKVTGQIKTNEKTVEKIELENQNLKTVTAEALVFSENLEKMLNKQVVIIAEDAEDSDTEDSEPPSVN